MAATIDPFTGATTAFNDKHLKIRKAYSWRRTPLSCDFESYCVNFKFSVKSIHLNWVMDNGNPVPRQENPLHTSFTKQFHCELPKSAAGPNRLCSIDLSNAIAINLMDLPDDQRTRISLRAAHETLNIINSSPPEHDSFTLNADQVQLVFHEVSHDQDQEVSSVDHTVQGPPRMVPATDESMKKLERKVLSASELDVTGKDCVICLEELHVGCEAVTMPCSHTFHGNCIEGWLKTSHYCPLCRFKMPNIDDELDC